MREALPIPLGSDSTLGLAGPNGTPDIAELPAPADPAGGVSCALAVAGAEQPDHHEQSKRPYGVTSRSLQNYSVQPSCRAGVPDFSGGLARFRRFTE